MGDPLEYQDPLEVWDPALKRNVYLGGQMSPAQYIIDNWANYRDYGGPVAFAPRSNYPITPQMLTGAATTAQIAPPRPAGLPPLSAAPTTSNSLDDMATQYQQYNLENARMVPGAPLRLGLGPDNAPIDLLTGTPLGNTPLWGYDPEDEANRRLLAYAQSRPTEAWRDVRGQVRGLGYNMDLGGAASPEEQRALQYLQGGGEDPRAYASLANQRQQRWRVPSRGPIDAAMRALTMAFIASGFGAMGGPAAAPVIATMMQAAGNNGRVNPYGAALASVASGASAGSGYGGVPAYVSQPVIGAATGAGGAAARGGNVLRGAAGGAVGGAIGGGLQSAGTSPLVSAPAQTAGSQLFNAAWPDDDRRRRRPNPYV